MRMSLFGKIGFIIGLLGGLAGITVAVIADPLMGSIFASIFILVFGGVYWSIFRPMMMQNKLLKTGVSAKAVIKELHDTGVTVNNAPQIKLLLEVFPQTGIPYLVETKMLISRLQTASYQPGMELMVKIDPNDKDKVAVDLSGGVSYGSGASYGSGDSYSGMNKQEAETMLKKINDENMQIMAIGESSRAIVTGYKWLGVYVNGNNPFVSLELEVLPETRRPFKAQAKGVISEQAVSKFQPGEEIYVKFDPNDTGKVTIEHS
jgi:hypothetical protein